MSETGQYDSVHALPAGVVTFLLTDIEGSTSAWEADAPAMAESIARHDSILSAAAVRHHGVRPVEQGEGDSMVIAFDRASDAVAAALDAQRVLWSEFGDRCRVRMAVHSGEAMVRLDVDTGAPRYTGRAIIATARLRSAAHGGQVLVSSATAGLIAHALPDAASLLSLGTVSLRGLAHPEPVFQLVHPELPAGFAALRELAQAPHSIPVPPTSFLGRGHDLEQLGTLTSEHRLVTITGTGGVGKTRLAQHLALDHLDESMGGVWWVELAPATTTEGVIAAVADGIGLALAPGVGVQSQFVRHLGETGAVTIVLDNCEHVVELIGDLIMRLLAAVPNLRMVTTSREPLGLPGEQVWRVASLAVPPPERLLSVDELMTFDAAKLFVERARESRPNLVVDSAAVPHIAAICQRLDGVALAIELAAARTRAMPLDALARALDDSFRILTGGSRTLMPRQQTLLASIGWSVALLAPAEQTALRRLAICPGAFDLDAAEAIAADEIDLPRFEVLDALMALVDKSLVEFVPETGSYRMLETIRQFALDRLLVAGEVSATLQRHAEYWANRTLAIEVWRDPDPRVRAHLADVFAMLDWAMTEDAALADRVLSSAGSVFGFGRWDELPRTCAFLMADRARGHDWPRAVATVSFMAAIAGRLEIIGVLDEAIASATATGDGETLHLLAVCGAYASAGRADPRPAVELFDAAVADDHQYAAFAAATGVGLLLALLGQLDTADRICTWVHEAARPGDGFTDTTAGAAVAQMNNLRGRFDHDDIPDRINGWGSISNSYSEIAALRGVCSGDRAWLSRAALLYKSDAGNRSEPYRVILDWATAALDGDLAAALSSLFDISHVGIVQAQKLESLRGATLAALERWNEVDASVAIMGSLRSSIPAAAPRLDVDRSILSARAARARGDRSVAESCAHDALLQAFDAGLRLDVIDALETVAAVSGDPARAARLAGSAAADRERCGYVTRLWSGLDERAAAELSSTHRSEWSDGEALTIEEAVGLARS